MCKSTAGVGEREVSGVRKMSRTAWERTEACSANGLNTRFVRSPIVGTTAGRRSGKLFMNVLTGSNNEGLVP
jgi:hypothetical protein